MGGSQNLPFPTRPNFWHNLEMGNSIKDANSCYCAFCRSQRRVYRKKNIHLTDIAGAALGAAVVMFAIWQEFDPRVVLIFVFFLAIAEIFVQIRWRLTISCKHCGFDPVLYTKDPQKAADKVSAFLESRKQDPHFLLSQPLNLTRIRKPNMATPFDKELALSRRPAGERKGQLVSKSI